MYIDFRSLEDFGSLGAGSKRVKSVMQTNYASTTTYFVGNYYEVVGTQVNKYYYAGSQRIAIPQGDDVRKNGTLTFIVGDHLGSTSLVTNASGVVINQTQYKAWGETRYTSGTEQTKYTYTGQYSYVSDFGLHFYNARWYDSSLGRFAQADTIVPSGVQGLDRYAYVNNNPVKYTDPSGHLACQSSYCDPRWYPYASPSDVIFSGTSGDAELPGPGAPTYDMPAWTPPGQKVIPYIGNQPGFDENGNPITLYAKSAQAHSARGIYPNTSINLICYSGGVESCLMYAVWRIQNNQAVNRITLLGPPFNGRNEQGQKIETLGNPDYADKNWEDWADYLEYIAKEGSAEILILEDGASGAVPESFQCQLCIDQNLYITDNTGLLHNHWGDENAGDTATTTSTTLRNAVIDWLNGNVWANPFK
jgi:RHS repeat-associated protein